MCGCFWFRQELKELLYLSVCPSGTSFSRKPNLHLSLSGLVKLYLSAPSYDRRSLLIPCLASSLTGTCKKWNADAEVSILSLNVSLLLYCVVSVLTSADMCWLLSPPQGVVCVVTVSANQRAA